MSQAAIAFADDEDVRRGAVIRIPAGDRRRPYCLRIVSREHVSQATGAIPVVGEVLGVNGTTTRAKRALRSTVLLPGRYEFVHKVPCFTARLATLVRDRGDGTTDIMHRWSVVNDETGELLPGEGTGPVVIEHLAGGEVHRWVLAGDWEGKPSPWLARESYEQDREEHRIWGDPLDQCKHRVAAERGILRIGDTLVYDMSVWHHDSAMVLTEEGWRCTRECKRCGQDLKWLSSPPWWAAKDGSTECRGEVWVP